MKIVTANGAKTPEIIRPVLPDSPCCGNCPFWHETVKAEKSGEFDSGQCRLNPPVNQVMPVATPLGQGVGVAAYWPQLPADQWCGKHPERASFVQAMSLVDAIENLREISPEFAQLMDDAGFLKAAGIVKDTNLSDSDLSVS